MTEQLLPENEKQPLFQSLILQFGEGKPLMNPAHFFENETEENEVYLIHQIQNFLYKAETDALEVHYICEQLQNEERHDFAAEERQSLLSPPDRFLLFLDFEYEKLKTDPLQGKDFYQTIIYQYIEEEERTIGFVVREIEHLEFVVREAEAEAEGEEAEKKFLRVHFVVDPLLPVPEKEKEQLLSTIRKAKFNLVQQ